MKICHVFLSTSTTDIYSAKSRVTSYEKREKKTLKLWVKLRRERWPQLNHLANVRDVRFFAFISTTQYVIQTPNIIILVFYIAPEMTSTSCKRLKRAKIVHLHPSL